MLRSPAESHLLLIRHGVCILVLFSAIAMLAWGRIFFIPLAFALLLTLSLNPIVTRLNRFGVPRSVSAALLLGALIALTTVAVLSMQDDAQELLRQLPASVRHFRQMVLEASSDRSGWWQRLHVIARSAGAASNATTGVPTSMLPGIDGIGATLLQGSLGAAAMLGQLVVVLFLSYFLLILKVPMATASRLLAHEIFIEIGSQAQRFVGVLVLTNLLLGVLTWLAFSLLGVSHAAVWGLAAGILHFIPYAGPAAMAAAAALASTVQFDSLGSGLMVAAVSLGLSTIVGVGITTWLTGRSVQMNAAAMFAGMLFWGCLWGLPGLLLGAPIMMTLKVVADRLPAMKRFARLLDRQPNLSP